MRSASGLAVYAAVRCEGNALSQAGVAPGRGSPPAIICPAASRSAAKLPFPPGRYLYTRAGCATVTSGTGQRTLIITNGTVALIACHQRMVSPIATTRRYSWLT
jgi:hypothetical protein